MAHPLKTSNFNPQTASFAARILANSKNSVCREHTYEELSKLDLDIERPSAYNPHHSYATRIITIEADPDEIAACQEREKHRLQEKSTNLEENAKVKTKGIISKK